MPVTIRIGVAIGNAGLTGLDVLLEQAEQAVYEAKTAGRNRFAAAGGAMAEEKQLPEPVVVRA